jgi:arylsulfatase A-like enzyme
MTNRARVPDILLIVMDCVSARDFVGGESPVGGLSVAQSLAKEGSLYDRAVAPASWTLPSHAGMFTGLYPWDVNLRYPDTSETRFPTSTLAENLLSLGYRTASFSANPFICGGSKLARGFEIAYWGNWSDCYFRKLTVRTSKARSDTQSGLNDTRSAREKKWYGRALHDAFLRFPLAADIATRLIGRAINGNTCAPARVAPWIEPAVDKWLLSLEKEEPAFCFVNFLDAHEPYIGLPEHVANSGSWLNPLLVPQLERDRAGNLLLTNRVDGEALRRLYRVALGILDRRIGEVLRSFRLHRSWDDLCVVVTSDHGQAFGEMQQRFHGMGVPDSVHRVPLIVKPALGVESPNSIHSWTSLVELPRIVASGALGSDQVSKVVRSAPGKHARVSALPMALSLAESTAYHHRFSNGRGRPPSNGGPAVVGYFDDYKVVIDSVTLENLDVDEGHLVQAWIRNGEGGRGLDFLRAAVTSAARAVRESSINEAASIVGSRLVQWGYD